MGLWKFVAAGVLLAGPVVAVEMVKQTTWGAMKATPASRQKGDPKAKLAIVEFSDFQCPMCGTVQPAIHQYLERYAGKIRFVYKYYPLVRPHPNAMGAAHAAECASRQDRFWPYHDKLFATQGKWAKLPDPSGLFTEIAQSLSLDMTQFAECVADPSKRLPIELDVAEAQARKVNATPTFFIGDERLVGTSFMTDGARTIEKELRKHE